jgi:hypothetical protein
VDAVEPAGPPPMTTTSYSDLTIWLKVPRLGQ